jgi:hypothetical protein
VFKSGHIIFRYFLEFALFRLESFGFDLIVLKKAKSLGKNQAFKLPALTSGCKVWPPTPLYA